jgi:hypothetical protein
MTTHMQKTGITGEEFAKLAAPFAAKDHEFNRGFIYIEETAICSRIEEVDFSWEWKTVSVTRENDVAIVVGALTINGITRYGTGQQVVQRDTKGGESVGEAAKGATTDALKRAARLFGIGRYLLDCPKDVKSEGKELNRWLASLNGYSAPQPSKESTHAIVERLVVPNTPASSTTTEPNWWLALKVYLKQEHGSNIEIIEKRLTSARNVLKQGVVDINSTLEDVLKAMKEEIPF